MVNKTVHTSKKNPVLKSKKSVGKKKLDIWDLPKLAKMATPNGEFSDEDKAIYEGK